MNFTDEEKLWLIEKLKSEIGWAKYRGDGSYPESIEFIRVAEPIIAKLESENVLPSVLQVSEPSVNV